MPGATSFAAEVTDVSSHCLWMLVDDDELVIPYVNFPWLKGDTIEKVVNVPRLSEYHFCWHDLNINRSVDWIRIHGGFH